MFSRLAGENMKGITNREALGQDMQSLTVEFK